MKLKEIIIIDKPLLDIIIAQMFSNNVLINLLDLVVNDEFVISLDDIAYLEFGYGSGDFLINPNTLVVYKRRKKEHDFDKDEKIGRLIFLKNNKLEIEPI